MQGGTARHRDVGSSPSRDREQRGSLGVCGGQERIQGYYGGGAHYVKSYLCFQREGTGLRTLLLATNNLKIKLRTPLWERGFRALVGGNFPFDINFTLMTIN